MPSLRWLTACIAGLSVCLVHPGPVTGQSPLMEALQAQRHVFEMDEEGRLAGPGARLLVDAGREARFFLIGEEHGVAEIPLVTAALYRALAPHGYRHLAIEIGDGLAATLNRVLLDGGDEGLIAWQRDHPPGVPFYAWREDASLLQAVVDDSGGRDDVLWGLDYDIVADRHALARLVELAPDQTARRLAESVRARADSAFEQAMATGNPGLLFMFGGPTDVYAELRAAYSPEAGSEADRLIGLMEETRAINGLFGQGRGYESNLRRARFNKRQFARLFEESRAWSGSPPRVMFKFGASHMVRGRSFTDVFDLGTVASELADVLGGESFHVLMAGGDGTLRGMIDPRVFRTVEAPAEMAAAEWARPFFELADPDRWTMFDLRPLRPLIPRFGELHPRLVQVLYGFDAFVVLSGSGPQHDLPIR
jgi:hypothetical protein